MMQPEQRLVGRVLKGPHVASAPGGRRVAAPDCSMYPPMNLLDSVPEPFEVALSKRKGCLVLDRSSHTGVAPNELALA